ncbi:hypothetical protein BDZ94DRAFT_1227961 [Collybia nuda]|uniref:Uncharacterized protein n=1 Tax=Collybia nuda TaxID=64659 RepID=A0A9P5XXA4_9AGAR|nr:hypothetical protein BDZ94DRAFT_1227961 [Collybia nuda]
MQRHVEEYNRTITVIFWYKAETEPIRLQQMIPTFPYFHLSCLSPLVTDLGLTNKSFVDTYDPRRGKWEQHNIETVRVVEPQERVLYRARRSLLDGLNEAECPGLREELHSQQSKHGRPQPIPSPQLLSQQSQAEWQSNKGQLKRPAPTPAPEPMPHPPKVHITNGYYVAHTASAPNPTQTPAGPPVASTSALIPTPIDQPKQAPQPSPIPAQSNVYVYQAPSFYPVPVATPAQNTATPPPPTPTPPKTSTSTPTGTSSIPYHPHPPLKRWPNDYTVSELTAGFLAMEALITQAPAGAAITQRVAFERVFGSRYVKSTVCRHRGVWKKAKGPLREQFEALGTDERACWGEFIRRVEGRPPAKGLGASLGTPVPVSLPATAIMMYSGHPGAVVQGQMVMMGGSGAPDNVQTPMMPVRTGEDGSRVEEEPIMASLQKPEDEDENQFQRERV